MRNEWSDFAESAGRIIGDYKPNGWRIRLDSALVRCMGAETVQLARFVLVRFWWLRLSQPRVMPDGGNKAINWKRSLSPYPGGDSKLPAIREMFNVCGLVTVGCTVEGVKSDRAAIVGDKKRKRGGLRKLSAGCCRYGRMWEPRPRG